MCVCPICSDGWSGSEWRAMSSAFHPLYITYVSFNYPKPFCAELRILIIIFQAIRKSNRNCSQTNLSVSLLKVTSVLVSRIPWWKLFLYTWYDVSTKNYCYLEHYQGKMNPSFLRGIYIKMKLFHPHIVSNTVICSFYSLGFLQPFLKCCTIQYTCFK